MSDVAVPTRPDVRASLRSAVSAAVAHVVNGRLAQAAVRHPWVVVVVLALLSTVANPPADPGPLDLRDNGDFPYFAWHGNVILHGHLSTAYADRVNQGGPLELISSSLLWHATAPAGSWWLRMQLGQFLATFVVLAAAIAITRVLLRIVGRPVERAVLAPAFAAVTGSAALAWSGGHLAQIAILVLWVTAAHRATQGKALTAGALIGLAAGFETWGVLGLPLLLLEPAVRRAMSSGLIAVAVAVAAYLPFVLVGPFEMFHMAWPRQPGTFPHLLAPDSPALTWWMRALQGGVVLALAAGAALWMRGRPHAIWAVPCLIVLVRLCLDVQAFDYYWRPLQVLLLVGAIATWGRGAALPLLLAGMAYTSTLEGAGGQRLGLLAGLTVLFLAALPRLRMADRDAAGDGPNSPSVLVLPGDPRLVSSLDSSPG